MVQGKIQYLRCWIETVQQSQHLEYGVLCGMHWTWRVFLEAFVQNNPLLSTLRIGESYRGMFAFKCFWNKELWPLSVSGDIGVPCAEAHHGFYWRVGTICLQVSLLFKYLTLPTALCKYINSIFFHCWFTLYNSIYSWKIKVGISYLSSCWYQRFRLLTGTRFLFTPAHLPQQSEIYAITNIICVCFPCYISTLQHNTPKHNLKKIYNLCNSKEKKITSEWRGDKKLKTYQNL